jgi:HAD superfamily hydrolase (TIGR01509 family)
MCLDVGMTVGSPTLQRRCASGSPGTDSVDGVLEAVLFDLDGTIVDTEPYWIDAERELVAEFGGTWSDDHAHNLVGNPLLVSAEYLREHGGVDLDPVDIVDAMLTRVIASTIRKVPWRPGAVELLSELRDRDVPCALVTMSYASLAGVVIDRLHANAFQSVVTGDEVRDGKPHPEAYLTAAERLGVDPERCIAIEDSPTGIASAEAAGCLVVAVPHILPITPGPRRILIDSLADVGYDRLCELMELRHH